MDNIYDKFIGPRKIIDVHELEANKNQVAGHSGICSISTDSSICLKQFNTKCVRGRREHLFYQLTTYLERNSDNIQQCKKEVGKSSELNADIPTIKYNRFPLLTIPSQLKHCDCIIDTNAIKSLTQFLPKFYHLKYLTKPNENHVENDSSFQEGSKISNVPTMTRKGSIKEYLESVYCEDLMCPCYGNDPNLKSLCAREYEKTDFLCLEDLTAHCRDPCVMDIKIGQITYDPMAIKEKIFEQSTKYERLREFGFRILGMMMGSEFRDKTFGKTLETNEHIYRALDGFFDPLVTHKRKFIVINQIMKRLDGILEWFETKNINQLYFFSSSLLIVYDGIYGEKDESECSGIGESVRVSMIDFAHVFHIHDVKSCKDNNYLYGLKRLRQFFATLITKYID